MLSGDAAINVQGGGWDHGLHFDVNSHGNAALKVDGNWTSGVDLNGNRMVLDVDDGEEIALRYDRTKKSIVFSRGRNVLWTSDERTRVDEA